MSGRFVLLSCLSISLGCQRLLGGAPDAGLDRGRLVVVAPAVSDLAEERITLLGDIQGELEVRVFAPIPERIERLHVRDGQAIAEGEPIATLDADLSSSGLEQAGAALAAAQAARDQLASELERARRLAASGAIPSAQVDALAAQLRTGDAQVAQLIAARRGAGHQRARSVIRAPISGTIALLTVSEGDTVAPTIPICTVVRADRVEVVLRLTEQDYVRVREGMEVRVVPPALPEAARTGMITHVAPVIDRLTRTATVEVGVDNADGRLRPGMVAQASIVLSRREGVTMIPARAVVMTPETDREHIAYVFVAEGEIATRREVRIGARLRSGGEERIEIETGITPGEQIVVEGQHLLRDRTRIRVEREAPASTAAAGT